LHQTFQREALQAEIAGYSQNLSGTNRILSPDMNASSLPTASRLLFDELLLQPNLRLRVGEHVIDIGALRIVTRPDHPRLTSKAAAVLIELVRHAGDTVMRDQLLDRVWADRVTTPDVLTQAIKELRRAFNDDAKPSRYIETIPKVGYRLLAPVSVLDADQQLGAQGGVIAVAGNDPELFDAPAPPAPAATGSSRPHWLWALVAAVLVAAVVAVTLASRGAAPRAAGSRWIASDVRALTSDPGSERRPAVSPDGTRVAYGQLDPSGGDKSVDRIMLRAIGESQSVRLTTRSSTFEEVPVWSPDGSQIAFERLDKEQCTMYIVSSLGGAEREVGGCQNYMVHYFDWYPDGKALISAQNLGGVYDNMVLMRWDLATGTRQPLDYERTPDAQDLEAHFSPDGKYIAFRRGLAPYSDLCIMAAAGGAVRQLTQLHSRIRGLAWTQDSHGLIFSSNHNGQFTLYTVAVDGGSVQPLGIGPAEYPSSARGADSVAYEIPRTTHQLAWVALGGDKAVPELLAKSTGSDSSPAFSPDGTRLAFVSDRSGAQQVWLYDFGTREVTALTEFHAALLINPTWSADGKRLLVTARGKDNPGLVEIDLASRRQRAISKPGEEVLSGTYGADPDSYLLVLGGSTRQNQLVLLEHSGGKDERQTALAAGIEHMELDAATRRLYYTKNAQSTLFARDLAGGAETLVTPLIASTLIDGWRVVDGRIWYVSKVAWKPVDLLEFDPATGAQRVLVHLEAELHNVGFSVTPKRDRVALTPLGTEDTDIGAFRLGATAR
jgi:Tol biopolymer transport system component/DNA-binding winged helix-turn-helix (wHTH) protein